MLEAKPKRKTILIRAGYTSDGACDSCGARITWAQTRRGAWMPMNRGFSRIIEGEMFRVFCDQSHFVSCPNAKAHRKGET